MHNSQIILISAAIAVLGIRLYQKYVKKTNSKSGTGEKTSSGTSNHPSSKDEDYEPYSKK